MIFRARIAALCAFAAIAAFLALSTLATAEVQADIPPPQPTLSNIPEDPSLPAGQVLQTPINPQDDTTNIPNETIQTVAAETGPYIGDVETTLFDIYLGDRFEGAVLCDYTDAWLKVSDPQAVIEQIKGIKDGILLLPLITETISKRRDIPKLGTARYDLNTFRLIIETAPEFLGVSNLSLKKVSADPNAGFSLQQRLGVTDSGSLQGGSRNAFSHKSTASYGAFYSIVDGSVINNQPYELTEASAGGILGDYRAGAGLLQTQGSTFAQSLQYSGLSIQTAEELFLDQDLIRGSSFQVFIPSRSKVEFFRDGRLLAVQVLDFGLREINTSAFPQGSYDVDIVITDSFGNVTRDRKFFTKSGYLASLGQPLFSLQAGNIRDRLTMLDEPVYQAGIRWRASSFFDLEGSVYGSDKIHIGTLESNGLYKDIQFGFGGSMSSQSDAGVHGSLGVTVLGTNVNVSAVETLEGGTKAPVLPTPLPGDPFGPIFNLRNRNTELNFQDISSVSSSISRPFGPVTLRFDSIRSSGNGTPTRNSYGPTAEWRVRQNNISSLKLQVSDLYTDRGKILSAGLSYSYRLSPTLLLSSELAHRIESEQGDDTALLFTLTYDDKESHETGTRMLLNDEVRSRNPSVGPSVTSFNNQIDIDHTGDYLQSIGFIRDSRTSSDSNTSIGVSANSSFLISSDGSVEVTHPVTQDAVFIADLPSKTTTSEFEVLLDNQVMAKVKAGEKAIIGVTAYRKYAVKIRPVENADLVSYDASASTITFFPGNVFKRIWKVEKVFIIIGRVVDENGQPIGRQRIKGPNEYTATEEDGTFQAEVGGMEPLTIDSSTNRCTLDINITDRPEYFVDLGDIRCLPKKED